MTHAERERKKSARISVRAGQEYEKQCESKEVSRKNNHCLRLSRAALQSEKQCENEDFILKKESLPEALEGSKIQSEKQCESGKIYKLTIPSIHHREASRH